MRTIVPKQETQNKQCTRCGQEKNLSMFSMRENGRYHSHCKSCITEANLQRYHQKNGKQQQKERSFKNLTKRYGISPEIYEQERIKQEYKCILCGTHETKSTHGRLHIDHCHETGKYRGLLCMNCNAALGSFKDNVEVMKKAIEYINENRTRHRDRHETQ